MADKADDVGRKVDHSDGLDHAVRFGMVVFGLVHLVIAWLALRLSFGNGSQEASGTGALRELAQQPFGAVLLWLVAAGMTLLVVWRLLEAAVSHRHDDGVTLWRERAVDVLSAVIYGAIAVSAVSVVTGSGSGGGSSTEDTMSAKVMQWPGGQWLVAAVGLGIIGYGATLVVRGLGESVTEYLQTQGQTGVDGRSYVLLGRVGHVAKGVVIGLVGGLFVFAGLTHDPSDSGGLDEALTTVLGQPFGPYLLATMALGIAAYGVFCFACARHLDR